jgi:hypothetical protein
MQVLDSSINSQSNSVNSNYSKEKLIITPPKISQISSNTTQEIQQEDEVTDPKLKTIIRTLEALTGEKIDLKNFKENSQTSSIPSPLNRPEIVYESTQAQSSSLDFGIEGSLSTKDGKEINFSLSIKWSETFVETNRVMIQEGQVFEDPLVISFDGMPPISNQKFDFDLTESVKELNYLNNAGYIVNDKNNNNKADDGSELFGPNSGDGFSELKAYDEDNNGWIDSNDSVYKQLKLFRPEVNNNELVSLEEIGIGAISLSTVDLNFTSKSGIDNPIANYKEGSVAVGEDGNAYGVFSVDLST